MHYLLLLVAFCLFACSPGSWSEKKSFPEALWLYADSLVIHPEISDTSSLHETWLEITVDESYPYSNLFVLQTMRTPSDSLYSQILEFQLMKEDGTWVQKPGWMGKVSFRFPLIQGFKFRETGTWEIVCKQYMRTDSLSGVHQIQWSLK